METSIIIRVKNEKENLEKLFEILKNQTYKDFEIVIVDNNSTDGSDRVVYEYFPKERIQVVNINKFSYSKACNFGAKKAKGKYLVYLSAHSFPITKTWLEDGLSNFKNDEVAGIFALPIDPRIAFSITNRIKRGGDLGNTNSIIRRECWEKHTFDEKLPFSEDYEWSKYWRSKGYVIVNDPRFRVHHTHNLGLVGTVKQHLKWRKMNKEINKRYKN